MSYRHLETPELNFHIPEKERFWKRFSLMASDEMTIDDHLEPFTYYAFLYGYAFTIRDATFLDNLRLYFNILSFVAWCSNGIYFIKTTDDKNAAIENLSTTLMGLLLLIKGVFFMSNKKEMKTMLTYMRKVHYKMMADKKYDKYLRRAWMLARLLAMFFCVGAISLSLSYLATAWFIGSLPLTFPAYGFEDPEYYVHNYFVQIWVVMVAGMVIPAVEGLCLYQILFLYAMIEIFIDKVKEIDDIKFKIEQKEGDEDIPLINCELLKEHLNDCVEFQQDVYWFSEEFHAGQKYQTLTIMGFSAIVGCVNLFQIMEGSGSKASIIRFYLFFILVVFIIYIYCLFGNIILNKSLEMADCIYNAPWYLTTTPIKRIFHLMILRSQKAIIINGVFFNVDLALFTSVAKTTYSYYTIMSNQED